MSKDEIGGESKKDRDCRDLYIALTSGKSNKYSLHDYSSQDVCIFHGIKIVILSELKCRVLEGLHGTHKGVVKIKAMARSFVW